MFLTGVEISVSQIGSIMGEFLARFSSISKVIIFGIFIGFTISIAEPDLLILANEVEGAIGMKSQLIVMIISLGIGIMISIGLFRMFKDIRLSILMCIIYGIVFILMIFTDEIDHAIAFDASGPMTATFILGFCQGVAGNIADGFGVISFVAMMPVLTIMIMGNLYKGAR